jgi:hypothetical protein
MGGQGQDGEGDVGEGGEELHLCMAAVVLLVL